MRLAIISDIHGNLIALEQVLVDIERRRVDSIVCLGDTAASGPYPHETLERLRALQLPVVMGNTDAWLLEPQASPKDDDDTRRIEEIDHWCAAKLTPADLDYIRTFQPTVAVTIEGGMDLLGFHGSPRSFNEIIVATTPDDELEPMFAGTSAFLLAGGHTHTQMLRRYRHGILINPGSVGLPHETSADGVVRNPPWAEYAIVESEGGRLSIDLRRVPVERDAVVDALMSSGMPHVTWWAEGWSL